MRRVVVLGAAKAASTVPAEEKAEEVVVLDPSPSALLEALDRIGDPRCTFLLGELPVLPLPDASVDAVLGAAAPHPELVRISR